MRMLLTGSYPRTLDEKHRIAIPKPLRDNILGPHVGGILYVAPGTDQSLVFYAESKFIELSERLARESPTSKEVREYSRLFYAQTIASELDRQGRVRLTPHLVELVKLEREVILLGLHDHLELWSRSRWETYLAERQARFDEIALRAFEKKHDH